MTNMTQTPQARASSAATELEDFADEGKVAKSEKSVYVDEEHSPDQIGPDQEQGSGNVGEKSPAGDLEVEKEVDVPPDGGYGWVCVACCAFINA
jgi:hypothetical protein